MRSHGMTTLTWDRHQGHSFSYDVVAKGYNYRLDEMRAALGIVQLTRLAEQNAKRRDLTLAFQEKLQVLKEINLCFQNAQTDSSHHIFPVMLQGGLDRKYFMAAMAERGIQTSVHYPPVHMFSLYQQFWPPGYNHRLPLTEDVAARVVTLPLFPLMTTGQLEEVVEAVKDICRKLCHGTISPNNQQDDGLI